MQRSHCPTGLILDWPAPLPIPKLSLPQAKRLSPTAGIISEVCDNFYPVQRIPHKATAPPQSQGILHENEFSIRWNERNSSVRVKFTQAHTLMESDILQVDLCISVNRQVDLATSQMQQLYLREPPGHALRKHTHVA